MVVSRPHASPIVEQAKMKIPKWTAVLDEGFDRVKGKINPQFVSARFCDALLLIEEATYERFREYQLLAYENAIADILSRDEPLSRHLQENYFTKAMKGELPLPKAMSLMIGEFFIHSYPDMSKLEVSLSNMRKKRAGETFQEILLRLLMLLNVPCQRVVGKDIRRLPRTDIVIPSVDVALRKPDRSYSIACIRTLRERWWKEVPSVRGGTRAYLVTIDPKVPEVFDEQLEKYGIVAFVIDKEKNEKFPNTDFVRRLSDLPQNLTQP